MAGYEEREFILTLLEAGGNPHNREVVLPLSLLADWCRKTEARLQRILKSFPEDVTDIVYSFQNADGTVDEYPVDRITFELRSVLDDRCSTTYAMISVLYQSLRVIHALEDDLDLYRELN